MTKKCKLSIIILILIILIGGYKFIIQGSVSKQIDGRIALLLTEDEKTFLLAEMRTFLVVIQQITYGIANDDMALVAKYSKQSGQGTQGEVPLALRGKLPLAFKKLGHNTHKKFDELAIDASSIGDKQHSLKQLSTIMQNCIACHKMYQVKVVQK